MKWTNDIENDIRIKVRKQVRQDHFDECHSFVQFKLYQEILRINTNKGLYQRMDRRIQDYFRAEARRKVCEPLQTDVHTIRMDLYDLVYDLEDDAHYTVYVKYGALLNQYERASLKFWLCGLTLDEIARKVFSGSKQVSDVKNYLYRGKQKIKRHIEHEKTVRIPN